MRSKTTIWGIVLAAAGLIAISGCGESDEDQVRDQATTYFNALGDGDFDEACEILRLDGQESIRELVGTENCSTAIGGIAREAAGVDFDSVVIDRVDVEGDTAIVGLEEDSTTLDFDKVDGEWLLREVPGS